MRYIIIIILAALSVNSQSLFIPVDFQKAYNTGTRTLSGEPGSDYWLNEASYNINAEIDVNSNILKGNANIVYKNNSPDILKNLWIRAYQNINRPETRKDFVFDPASFTEGMIFRLLKVNGRSIDPDNIADAVNHGTNIEIKDVNIPPGGTATIETQWEFEIPVENSVRMGRYLPDNFFIAYWYPQIAVYDDIDGWDETEYTGQVEFYNDFNDYDVKITVPSSFNLWATGELQNPDDVMKGSVRERYSLALNSEKVINIVRSENLSEAAFSSNTKTYHFRADDVPDFAFCMSRSFLWDGRIVNINSRKIFITTMYSPDAVAMKELTDISARAVQMLSNDLPGYEYPYQALTIFNGSGGMEFPMMVNQGGGVIMSWTVSTAVHEIVHMYFPFYLGINERKYAWMDEGWAQMLGEPVQHAIDPSVDYKARNVKRYLDQAGNMNDIPPMVSSSSIGSQDRAYDIHAYFRPGVAYNMLYDLLGGEMFKKCLVEYIRRWNGRHPTPYDFFFTFENVSGKNLRWFWGPWFFDITGPDLGILDVNYSNNNTSVTIGNITAMPVPVEITFMYTDGTSHKEYRPITIWEDGSTHEVIETQHNKNIKLIHINSPYIPDINDDNDYWNK